MPNVMVLTNLNTTDILCGIAKIIASLMPLDWKLSRVTLTPIPSNASTVKMITKQTLTFVFSESIGLIVNDIQKNTKKSMTQNVCKNNFVINTILDIIFIQEPSWSVICSIPSSRNEEENILVGIPNHLN